MPVQPKLLIKPIFKVLELIILTVIVCLFAYDGPIETNGYLTFTNGDIGDWYNYCIVTYGASFIITALLLVSYLLREAAIINGFHEISSNVLIGCFMNWGCAGVIFSSWVRATDNPFQSTAFAMGGLSVFLGVVYLLDGMLSAVIKRRMAAVAEMRMAAQQRQLQAGDGGGVSEDESPRSHSRL